jgi:hypothetical protein
LFSGPPERALSEPASLRGIVGAGTGLEPEVLEPVVCADPRLASLLVPVLLVPAIDQIMRTIANPMAAPMTSMGYGLFSFIEKAPSCLPNAAKVPSFLVEMAVGQNALRSALKLARNKRDINKPEHQQT